MLKKGFTLTEVMIVFVVVGILCAMLLPKLFSATPDEEKLKAKKAYNTLTRAVEYLTNSGPYAVNNGSLDAFSILGSADADKENRLSYFCNNLADILNIKSVDCSTNVDDLNTAVGNATYNNNGACTFATTSAASSNNTVCMNTTSSNGATIPDYDSLQDNLDAVCNNFFTNEYEYNFQTSDGTLWAVQRSSFRSTDTVTANGISQPSFYNVICIDTGNQSDDDYIFGVGVRIDGKIVAGTKLQAILEDED